MNIRMEKNSIFNNSNMQSRNKNVDYSWIGNAGKDVNNTDIKEIKRRLNSMGSTDNTMNNCARSVVDQSISYADSLSISRMNKKSVTTRLKRLRYNFKRISSQILRSKTSASARMAVSAAKRVTLQLKRQLKQGVYDEEEVQLAIDHAKAMERVAKKKVKHLEEEERFKDSGGVCSGEIEEEAEAEASEDEIELSEQDMEELLEDMEASMEDSMKEIMEETYFSELMELFSMETDAEKDPADFKMMKIKHRREELKAIAKADAKYLKGMFDKYEADKGGTLQQTTGNPVSTVTSVLPAITQVEGFDVSV
ncbi:MAG: hypothetical protein Q4F11_08540 [Eubacteriales bacterium]|nr:hypothetical protein [Eubacteriales bacterium]